MPDKHENNVNITAEPTVGVFWLFKRRLIIESVPVSQAEACEGFCNHPLSHEQCWSQLQRRGVGQLVADSLRAASLREEGLFITQEHSSSCSWQTGAF